jgi:hypothetical protein
MKVMNWAPYPAIRCESSPPRRSAGSSLLSGARAHACRTIPLNCLRGLIVAFLKTIKFPTHGLCPYKPSLPTHTLSPLKLFNSKENEMMVPPCFVSSQTIQKWWNSFLSTHGLFLHKPFISNEAPSLYFISSQTIQKWWNSFPWFVSSQTIPSHLYFVSPQTIQF